MAVSKVVSIEINDLNTKVCEISYNKKTPVIHKTVRFDNPQGTVVDSYIEDRTQYSLELKDHLKKAGIKCKDVVFILSGNKVLNREVTIPDMKEKLIDDYIEAEKASYFPMDISDHKIDYIVVDKNPDTKEIRILLYAAPERLVKNYNALAAELGFRVVAMDSSGNTLYQYLSHNTASGMDMYLQINENNALFTILDNGKFALQRNMNFGIHSLAEHLIDEEYYGVISIEQAMAYLADNELLFHSFAEMMEYMPSTEAESRLYECKKRLTEAVRPLVGAFTRVLEYYNTRNKNAAITRIYIGGCGSRVRGLDRLLMSEFEGIEMIIVGVLPNIKFSRKDKLMVSNSTEFISCIGATNASIDFSKEAEGEEKKGVTAFAVLAGILTLAAVAALVGIPLLNYKQALDEQSNLRKSISEYQSIIDLRDETEQKRGKLDELTAFDESTVTNNEDWNHILEQLEIMLPSNTLVSSLSSNETGVTMVVTIPTKLEAAKLLVQMRNLPIFEDVQISTLNEVSDEATGIKNESFTVTCLFPQPEEPQEEVPASQEGEEGEEETAE